VPLLNKPYRTRTLRRGGARRARRRVTGGFESGDNHPVRCAVPRPRYPLSQSCRGTVRALSAPGGIDATNSSLGAADDDPPLYEPAPFSQYRGGDCGPDAGAALSQPRRGPPHHPRHGLQSGDTLDGRRRSVGHAPTVPRACWSRAATHRQLQGHPPLGLCRCAPPRATSPRRCCSTGCRPDRMSSIACAFRTSRSRPSAASRWLAVSRPRPADKTLGILRLVRRHDGAGLGHRRRAWRHEVLRHDAEETDRTSSSIPATRSTPTDRSRPKQKISAACRRRRVEEHRHRGKVEAGRDARRISRQLQIQSDRQEPARLQWPKSQCSRSGTTTRSPTTGGRPSR